MTYGSVTISGFRMNPPDVTAPTVPVNLVGITGDGSITLSWNASTDASGVDHYRLYRNNVFVKNVYGLTTSDNGLTNYVTYVYTVDAVDAIGNASAMSSSISIAPSVTYSGDTFTRSNSSSLGSTEIGSFPWTANPVADQSIYVINGGTLQKPLANATLTKELLIDDGHSDGTIQVKLVSAVSGVSGLVFRVSSDYSTGFLWSRSSAVPAVYTLKRRSGTAYTTLYTQSPGTGATGDILKVVLNGSSIKCYVNGTLLFTTNDTISQTGTKHGGWFGASGITSLDDWLHTGATS